MPRLLAQEQAKHYDLVSSEKKDAESIQKTFGTDAVFVSMYESAKQLEKLTDEERINTLKRNYDEYYQPRLEDESASKREKRRLNSEYAGKKENAGKTIENHHKKVLALAQKYANRQQFEPNENEEGYPEALKALAEAERDEIQDMRGEAAAAAYDELKERAPKLYEEYRKIEYLEQMGISQEAAEGQLKEYAELIKTELAIARAKWENCKAALDRALGTNVHIDRDKRREQLVEHDELTIGGPTELPWEYQESLKQVMKKHSIDWERDVDGELDAARLELEELKKSLSPEDLELMEDKKVPFADREQYLAGKYPGLLEAVHKVCDLEFEKNLFDQTKKVAGEASTDGRTVTPKEVEETVNEYLSRLSEHAAVRMKAGIGACMAIMQNRYTCGKSKDYQELISKMFHAGESAKPSDCIAFGYLGSDSIGENIAAFQQAKHTQFPMDSTDMYGMVSIRYKDEVRSRTTFVNGNSRGYYDRARAVGMDAPDIRAAGSYIPQIYARARAVLNGEAQMETPELEANKWNVDFEYSECQIHGNLGCKDIDELSFKTKVNLGELEGEGLKRHLQNMKEGMVSMRSQSRNFIDLYEFVKIVNDNLRGYGRTEPIKLNICDYNGHVLDFDDLARILG